MKIKKRALSDPKRTGDIGWAENREKVKKIRGKEKDFHTTKRGGAGRNKPTSSVSGLKTFQAKEGCNKHRKKETDSEHEIPTDENQEGLHKGKKKKGR